MKKHTIAALLAFQVPVFGAQAQSIEINFDTDAFGNPFSAPQLYVDTVRLTEFYASLGVHFSGPGGNDGGAIVNENGNSGVDAHSGTNFLGFNRGAVLMDGGIPRDPETITFDTLASTVSIYAGGPIAESFLMQGFDINGILIATDTLTTQEWGQLEISSATGIKSVTLFVTGPPDQGIPLYFVYDDLSVDLVPEPSVISLLMCAAGAGFAFRRLRCGGICRRADQETQ
jgi:hypothetical protein